MAVLFLAIIVTAIGISLTVGMHLVPNPGEGVANAISIFIKKDLGYGKNILDLSCVIVSCTICLIFSPSIQNIGLGTILSMILTGRFVKIFQVIQSNLFNVLE